MHRRHLLATWGALAAGAVAGCLDDDEAAPAGPEPNVDDEQLAALISQTNAFSLDLHRRLVETAPEDDWFSSPLSVSFAFAMAYAGARGETATELRDAFRYELEEPALHEAFGALQAELNDLGAGGSDEDGSGGDGDASSDGASDGEVVPFELSIVNAVWGQADYPFRESYLQTLETHYGGGFHEVDFQESPDSARETINDWVADETGDRIEELLPGSSIDRTARMVLTNAVYFLGNWAEPFPERETSQAPFEALSGETHEVPTMEQVQEVPYGEVDGAAAVELPYVGETASMLVVLPPPGEFERYEQSFDAGTLGELQDALEETSGRIRLPRFEFGTDVKLAEPLGHMGASAAFRRESADFGDVADLEAAGDRLAIDDAYHEAVVAVDEEGTEAAAATATVLTDTSAPAVDFEFVADRPFLFVIRDRTTETILFLGRAVDPAGWE